MSLNPALETPSADEWREIHKLRQQGKWLTPEEAKRFWPNVAYDKLIQEYEKMLEEEMRQREPSREAPPATWHPLLDDETWVGPYEVGMYAWLVDDEADPAPQLLPDARMELIYKALNHLTDKELCRLRTQVTNQLDYRDMKKEGEEDA